MEENNFTQSPMYVGNANPDFQWIGGKLVNVSDVIGLKKDITNYNYGVTPNAGVSTNIGNVSGLAANQYVGKNKTGEFALFDDSNLQNAAPGSITAANVNGVSYDSNTPTSDGFGATFKNWFTPGEKGTSLGGNVLKGFGDLVGGAAGLAGMYYAKKNFDLQKQAQQYEQNKDAQRDKNISQFAKNAGGGASYAM